MKTTLKNHKQVYSQLLRATANKTPLSWKESTSHPFAGPAGSRRRRQHRCPVTPPGAKAHRCCQCSLHWGTSASIPVLRVIKSEGNTHLKQAQHGNRVRLRIDNRAEFSGFFGWRRSASQSDLELPRSVSLRRTGTSVFIDSCCRAVNTFKYFWSMLSYVGLRDLYLGEMLLWSRAFLSRWFRVVQVG